uniref:Uncharacterized protein n=1 Tax=Arundo donax TaxID=35708 RepID=A0A0A9AIF3_ARUDO
MKIQSFDVSTYVRTWRQEYTSTVQARRKQEGGAAGITCRSVPPQGRGVGGHSRSAVPVCALC